MELLRGILLSVLVGAVIAFSCSQPPAITLRPTPFDCDWSQAGGDESRAAFYDDSSHHGDPHFLWKQQIKAPLVLEPSIQNGSIFLPATDKTIYVNSLNDGRQQGRLEIGLPIVAPCVVKDSLIAVNEFGRSLSIRNWITGQKIWGIELFGSDIEPLLYEGRLYWQDGKRLFHCFGFAEGKRIWEKALDYDFVVAPAACSLGLVVVASTGHIAMISLDDGHEHWRRGISNRIRNSPVISGDALYYCTVDGKVTKVNLADGSDAWETQLDSPSMAPQAADGEGVYFGASSGTLLKVGSQDGAILWRSQLDGPIRAGITILGKIVISTSLNHRVYFVDKNAGAIRFEYETEGMISARPVVCGNRVYVAGEDKNLYCFQVSDER